VKEMAKLISKENLFALLDTLIKNYTVLAPVEDFSGHIFREIKCGKEASISFKNTVIPPKALFFPPVEEMFRFKFNKTDVALETCIEEKKQVIFGIRPCDISALSILDKVAEDNFKNNYYIQMRKNIILIGLSCNHPMPTCFCDSLQTGPFTTGNADIMLTDLGDKYFVDVLSPKGKDILVLGENLFTDASEADLNLKVRKNTESVKQITRKIDLKLDLGPYFESQFWEKLGLKCLGCAACTYLCPTCFCFDVLDEVVDNDGVRIKCWDSCMFPSFSRLAGGANPRATKKERLRHRIFHKFKYFLDKYKIPACVGCGRCITACSVNLDITKILSDIKGV
jgi:ferredoxin